MDLHSYTNHTLANGRAHMPILSVVVESRFRDVTGALTSNKRLTIVMSPLNYMISLSAIDFISSIVSIPHLILVTRANEKHHGRKRSEKKLSRRKYQTRTVFCCVWSCFSQMLVMISGYAAFSWRKYGPIKLNYHAANTIEHDHGNGLPMVN